MRRIITFGTFDIVHPGHIQFLKKARNLGNFLIIVVARDKFVVKTKGRLPNTNERSRVKHLRYRKIADKVILGSNTYNYFRTLRTQEANTLVLGYDQEPKIVALKNALRRHGLKKIKIVRLKSFKPGIYKSSKIAAKNG